MGLYYNRCKKCGKTWIFCSVTPMQIIGEPCECGSEYNEQYIPE
jgi:hypothetical protein